MSPGRVRSIVHRVLDADRAARRYRVPRIATSDLDDARLLHEDLIVLDDVALRTEEACLLGALSEQERPGDERAWLVERAVLVAAERRRRDAR